MSDAERHLPLTPTAFEILLALGGGDLHGYAILQKVEEGRAADPPRRLHAGTLYRALARMVDDGLLIEVDGPEIPADDERRRYYRLTPLGRQVAAAEVRRLEAQLLAARSSGILPGEGAGG